MKLNRYNYEEYFILYMDNELNSDDRREVEIFLQENPDLKAEMDMLLHSRLIPDTDINFNDKRSLMRFGSNSISMTNYEECLLSYIDDELDDDERKEVEKFLAANPAIQKELSLFQNAKLQPEAIVFPNKESLYRREEKLKVIAIRWWRVAAAAVLLLGLLAAGIVLLNNKSDNDRDKFVKKTDTPLKPGVPVNDDNDNKDNNNSVTPDQQFENIGTEEKEEIADKNKNEPPLNEATKYNVPKEENQNALTKKNEHVKKEEPVIVQTPKDNNLAKPDNNPNVNPRNSDAVAGAGNSDKILTNSGQKTKDGDVTLTDPNSSDKLNETYGEPNIIPGAQFASNDDSKSNKGIRGFLRKVTRTFEKRTNIKATDDDDRLLIAGLAIKLN